LKIGMAINYASDFAETTSNLVDFESVGLDRVALPEAYTFDAVSQLGYIAAKTRTLELATGILPMFSRTPTNLAMTAAGLDYVSGGRFVLGIGASGPQVIEGFHGVKYDAPLARARETAEICRMIWRREPSSYNGKHYTLPLTRENGGSGLGKPLKIINHPVRERIPMLLAAIGPKNVELAAELFEEWQPVFVQPEHLAKAYDESLAKGMAKRAPELGELGISVHVTALVTDDEAAQEKALNQVKGQAALYIGGMGARGKNFYNDLAVRYGYVDAAKEIQDLYLDGKKLEATSAVPDELARGMSLIGPAGFVADRLAAFDEAGVTTLLVNPAADTHAGRVEQIRQLKRLAG
jgi:F420-dependent oxidoreductase-like protein